MKELSIFIDESGDFGFNNNNPSYYIATFIFHNQFIDISDNISKLKDKLKYIESNIEYIHLGPIIRKESVFNNLTIDQRREYAYTMLNFVNSIPINHFSVAIDKVELSGKLSKTISSKINEHIIFFSEFRKSGPQNYVLLQAANFICTLELLKIKKSLNQLSKSEASFFYKLKELSKTFIKSIDKKQL